VGARGVGEGMFKFLQYWSTGNGDDTMVTVWNPADEVQDFAFTLYYTGGHYTLRTATPSVSSAKLPSLQLRVKTLSEATDILLQQKAMQDHPAALNTTEAPDNIGFSSIRERELRIVSIPPGTLKEDLNTLASAFGAAVWKLDQHDCRGNRTFRLSWIAK